MKKVIIFCALIFGATFLVSAGTGNEVARKQVKQHNRIVNGVVDGELTRPEARKLINQQKHIQIEKQIAKADGVITRREKAHIKHDQRVANRSIYRQKNDSQNRF